MFVVFISLPDSCRLAFHPRFDPQVFVPIFSFQTIAAGINDSAPLFEEKWDFGSKHLPYTYHSLAGCGPRLHAWIERYNNIMKQEIVLQTLKQKNAEMTTQFGVKSLLLFGSVARNEATSTSDVDLLVEFNRPVGYFGLFALQDYLEKLLGCPVDLGTPYSLKPYIKERVMGELIRVA